MQPFNCNRVYLFVVLLLPVFAIALCYFCIPVLLLHSYFSAATTLGENIGLGKESRADSEVRGRKRQNERTRPAETTTGGIFLSVPPPAFSPGP